MKSIVLQKYQDQLSYEPPSTRIISKFLLDWFIMELTVTFNWRVKSNLNIEKIYIYIMRKKVYIWGAGHYGVLTALDLEQKGVKIEGFIDKNASQVKTRLGLPVLDLQASLSNKFEKPNIVIAVQNELARQNIVQDLLQAGLEKDVNFELSHILPQLKTSTTSSAPQPLILSAINIEKCENSLLGNNILKISYEGYRFPFYIRNKTSDVRVYKMIIENSEYDFVKIREPRVIIDAGANIGLAGIYFAEKFPDAKIISIEPEEDNFKLLKENTKNYPNIIPLKAALWDKSGEIELLDVGLDNWGFMTGDGSHYDKITTPKLQKRHIVKTITVENILKNYGFDRIDILKMDIEGAEKEVFNDCDKWIDSVSSIVVELHERMKKGCEEAFEKIRGNFSDISKYGEDIFLYSSQ